MMKLPRVRTCPPEDWEQLMVVDHLKGNYPGVVFNVDGSGINQAGKLARVKFHYSRSSNGIPDMHIHKVVLPYYGLYLEIKALDINIFKACGVKYTSKVIENQAEVIRLLNAEGYYANFAIGHEAANIIIDLYMEGELKRFEGTNYHQHITLNDTE